MTGEKRYLPTQESGEKIYITPSRPNPWRAHRVDGQWYTHFQARWMAENGVSPDRVDLHIVYSPLSEREYYDPALGPPTPVYEIACPVTGRDRRGGKRLRVIAPDGTELWVAGDGTTKGWRWMTPWERNRLALERSAGGRRP